MVGEPGCSIGQDSNPFCSEDSREMPQAVTFAVESHQDSRGPPSRGQLPDVASHQHGCRSVPMPASFCCVGCNAQLRPGSRHDPLHLSTKDSGGRHQQDVLTTVRQPRVPVYPRSAHRPEDTRP